MSVSTETQTIAVAEPARDLVAPVIANTYTGGAAPERSAETPGQWKTG